MGMKTYKAEQIIGKLREAEVLLNQGSTVGEASKKIGVSEQTYYRWRKEYGGMRVDQAKRRTVSSNGWWQISLWIMPSWWKAPNRTNFLPFAITV